MTRNSVNCGECNIRVAKQRPNMQCIDCKKWYHSVQCTKINELEERLLCEQKKPWSCKKCKRLTISDLSNSRLQNRDSLSSMSRRSHNIHDGHDFESIYSLLMDLKSEVAEIRSDMTEVKSSLEFLNGMYEEQRQLNKVMGHMIDEVKSENKKLRNDLSFVQARLIEMEADKVSTNLNIFGAFERDDTEAILREKSLKVLNFVENSVIPNNIVHIKTIPIQNKPPMLCVSLNNPGLVKKILSKRREVGNIDTQVCRINDRKTPIYINEHLPELAYKLFKEAKKCREKGFKYVWYQSGSVLLRRNDGGRVIKVRNSLHLQEILEETKSD